MNDDQAVEPWRAAWMAFREAAGFDYADDRAPDDELDAQWIAAWKAAAQAALAAAGKDAEPQPAPELAAAGAALARVLSWFAGNGTRREASATRAQLAHAHQDGGLTVPEELRRFL